MRAIFGLGVIRLRRLVGVLSLGFLAFLQGCASSSSSSGNPPPPPPPVSVQVTPASASVGISTTQQFNVTVTGTTATAVSWYVNGVLNGEDTRGPITQTGLYTAPAIVPSPPTVTVTAILQSDPSKFASATVTITSPPDSVPPTPPSNLTATATSNTTVLLNWAASTDNVGVAEYRIERCLTSSCASYSQVGRTGATTFGDTGLTTSTSYTYRVRAVDAAGNRSSYSNTATVTTSAIPDTTPPTAPGNLAATASSNSAIGLTWTASTDNVGVTGYRIERCSGTGCSNFVQIATTSGATTFSDGGLTASTSYSYRVRAADDAGNLSAYSNTASATTQAGSDTTPPSAPSNLAATASSNTAIGLTWTASTDNVGVTGYRIERCAGSGCSSFAQIGTTTTATTFSDSGLTASTSYSYRVRATDAAGNLSAYSNTASATTQAASDTTPPTAPANLAASASSSSAIGLTWTASTDNVGVTGYRIERCTGSGCSSYAQIGTTTTATTFSDTGLTASTSYSYRVRATDAAGNLSAYSNTASATTQAASDTTPPTAPSNLTATASSSSAIGLTWTASTDNVGVTGYRIERCSGSSCSSFAQVGTTTTATTFSDTGLTASTSYSYRVRATDAAGNLSSYSNTATATTQSGGSITVSVSPKRGGLVTSQTLSVTATLTNDTGNQGVNWTFNSTGSTGGGGFSSNTSVSGAAVTFTAPSSAGVVTITATSVADATQSATATIGVTDLSGVLTYHNNLSRDGTNQKEYALTTSNVATGTFGKLFTCSANGAIYAQPLWIPKLNLGGTTGVKNVVLVATMRDSVYLFDADTKPCVTYWSQSLIPSGETYGASSDLGSSDIFPDIGILGTPVIDPSTNTVYLVTKTKTTGGTYHQRLHALSLIDGSERSNSPVDLTSSITVSGSGDTGDSSCPSSSGNVPFCPKRENQRPGLVLSNGVVYVSWASHGDVGPYHGWVMGFNASTLAMVSKLNVSPNGRQGGIWMSGGAPAVDSGGNLYVITGNGDFDGSNDFGDSVLKLSSTLSIIDSFTPANQASLDASDLDFGAGAAVVLVDLPNTAAVQHLLIGGGKGAGFAGELYVLNRDGLGGYQQGSGGTDNVVQGFSFGKAIFSTPVFWQNTVYIAGFGGVLNAFALNTTSSTFNTVATSKSSNSFSKFGATPSLSSSGSSNGIVWAIDFASYGTSNNGAANAGPAVLHAYDASNLASELWNSSQGSGNAAGNAVKFIVPTVANGKVYVGTRGNDSTNPANGAGELDVYGLLPN